MSRDTRILVEAACGTIGHIPAERSQVPRQLPRAVPGFIGRTDHLAELDALPAGGTIIAAVVGTAGAGKTSLAVHWAQQAQHRFPDGTLYVNLRGYDPGVPVRPGDVLADFLCALGIPPDRIPPRLDARAALYRSVLAQRRVLIVLDNASDVVQVRPLLPGGAGCVVVVTSRADLKGLEVADGARRIPLALFSEPEAVELVRTVLGSRADAEPGAVAALVEVCAGLPLALRIAAGRAATHPHSTIAELVRQLESERWQALSVPADEHNVVRKVFDWSYRWLPEPQARMFRRLGLHPAAEIGVHAAAALDGLDLRTAEQLMADLAEQHLVEPVGPGRYSCHDLLRAYAADLAELDDDRDEARHRLFGWYTHHATSAYRAIYPDRAFLHERTPLAVDGRPEITFAGPREAWAWADTEAVVTTAVVRAAADRGLHAITVLLADICTGGLMMTGRFDDAREVCRIGLTAARATGDGWGECWALVDLGMLCRAGNRWQEATGVFESALTLARELGHDRLLGEVLGHLGWGCLQLGEFGAAQRYLREAGELVTATDHRSAAFLAFGLSGVHAGLGDHEAAFRHAEQCLALLRQLGDLEFESHALQAMARARQVAGAHAEAVALCEHALEVESERESPWNHALLLDTFGESLRHTGAVEKALACWREALVIFDAHGEHRALDLRERLAALVSANAG